MKHHDYIWGEGGTGLRLMYASYICRSSEAYAAKSVSNIRQMRYCTMDAGNEEIEKLKALIQDDKKIGLYDPLCPFTFTNLSELVKEKYITDETAKTLTLRDILGKDCKNIELLFTEEELDRDLLGGYYRNSKLGRVIFELALGCALDSDNDRISGFQAVVNDVIASNGTYEVRLVICAHSGGGEGKTNASRYPGRLKEMCIEKAMERFPQWKNNRKSAKEYVEKILRIAVVMTAVPFCFPETEGLDNNVAALTKGTIENYPKESMEAVNILYLLDHDGCPVQASEGVDHGQQKKHAHAIELVGAAAIDNFFERDSSEIPGGNCVSRPHYSYPGRYITNWENLGLPEEYRRNITARIRFDAALFYWIRPQFILTSEEKAAGKLYESEILAKMLGVRNDPKLIKREVERKKFDIESEIISPLKALLDKETQFLNFIFEVSQTGRNWMTSNPSDSAFLFDLTKPGDMLRAEPDIRSVGGMGGFKFDDLSRCPVNPDTGKAEDNIYITGLTMEDLRDEIVKRSMFHNETKTFKEILCSVYDICRKEH